MKVSLLTTNSLINLSGISEEDKHQMYFITDVILNTNFNKNKFVYNNRYFSNISSTKLQDISNKEKYKQFLNTLINNNIIVENKSYSPGTMKPAFTKSYKIVNENDISIVRIETKNKPNLKRINKLFNNKYNKTPDEQALKQINFFAELQLNKESFDEVITDKYKEKGIIYGTDSVGFESYKTNILYHIRKIENWDFTHDFFLYDDFSGRFFNVLTNIPSAMRKCLEHPSNDLVEIDIRSSQVYFLSQLDILIDKLNIQNVDISQIEIEDEFKEIILNQDIYLDFANYIGKSRDEAKSKMLPWLYGYNSFTTVAKYLESKFPLLYKTLIYLKNIHVDGYDKITNLPNGKQHHKETYLNYVLQYAEKEILFGSIENIENYYTVHDSVVTINSQAEEVEQLIYQRCEYLGLAKPKLKITRFDKKLDLTINI